MNYIKVPITLDICNFGHMGDNNLHLNILLKPQEIYLKDNNKNINVNKEFLLDLIQDDISNIVYNHVINLNGSISAEHGIGQKNKKYLLCSKSNNEINLMKQFKLLIDPNLICNPNKIIDI